MAFCKRNIGAFLLWYRVRHMVMRILIVKSPNARHERIGHEMIKLGTNIGYVSHLHTYTLAIT